MDSPGLEPGAFCMQSRRDTATPRTLRKHNICSLNHVSLYFKAKSKNMRRPGIEPGPSAWKADILTTRPTTPLLLRSAKKFILSLATIRNANYCHSSYSIDISSHSSVGQSVGLINLRSAVRARVGAFSMFLIIVRNLLILGVI